MEKHCWILINGKRTLFAFVGDRKIDINKDLNLEFDKSTKWQGVFQISAVNDLGMMVGHGSKNNKGYAILIVPCH